MSKKKSHEILFQLTNIEVIGAELSLPKDFVPQMGYEFDIKTEVSSNRENELIKLLLEIAVRRDDHKYGGLSAIFWFAIEDFNNIIAKNKAGKYQIPGELQLSINSIAISTARGLLFSAFRGTPLHSAILPVIDVEQLEIGQE